MKRSGVSLIELLVVLAVLGILLSLAYAAVRPSHVQRAGQALRSAILWARANAIWHGATVSVTELPGGGGFVVRLPEPGGGLCGPGKELLRLPLSDHPGVRLAAGLPRGLAWLPSGGGRSCDGGGVVSATIRLLDARGAAEVIISSLGRVRLQVPP